ncbi:MAG: host attachment protein [Glycocaulis sp.]
MSIQRKGMLWLVVADGHNVRILARMNRASPLALVGRSTLVDGSHAGDRDGDGHRLGLEDARALRADRQERFLSGVADLINLSATANHFEHLVLAAPAKALGVLRAALNDKAASRVCAHFSVDLANASEAELAAWLSSTELHERDGKGTGSHDNFSAQQGETPSRTGQMRPR